MTDGSKRLEMIVVATPDTIWNVTAKSDIGVVRSIGIVFESKARTGEEVLLVCEWEHSGKTAMRYRMIDEILKDL